MVKILMSSDRARVNDVGRESEYAADHAEAVSRSNGSHGESQLVDEDTAAIIDEETEDDFDWRAELLQMNQENRRNEVAAVKVPRY